MTILITSDWHLSANPRDEYRFGFVEKLLPNLLIKQSVKLLLFLGDVCEEKDNHNAELVNRVVEVFEHLSEICPIVCLQGNHDWLSSPDNPYFGFLARLGGRISWVGVPTPLATLKNVPESVSRACKAILLPHSADFERDWGEIDFRKYDYAFAHQSFAGAKSESGFSLPGGVPLSYFPGKLKIISGDIHRPQTVQNLTYVGSPTSIDFGDYDFENPNRVLLLKEGELTSIPVKGPQKILVTLSGKNPLAALRMSHPLAEALHPLHRGDIVKVRVEIDSYDKWPEARDEIERWAEEEGVILHQAPPIIQNAVSAKTKLDPKSVKTDEELLSEYAKKRQLAEGYLNIGLKLL